MATYLFFIMKIKQFSWAPDRLGWSRHDQEAISAISHNNGHYKSDWRYYVITIGKE